MCTMAYILDVKGVLWRAQGGIAELSWPILIVFVVIIIVALPLTPLLQP